MYHGSTVPGFPQHPHRGFETITYVREGRCDHTDSLGAQARFGEGDTQWVTAGRGIVHAEMFPLVHTDEPNPLELFQIWLNLPAANKMVDPYFTMHWAEDTPRVRTTDDQGRSTTATIIAGRYGDTEAQQPPPDSWASSPGSEVAVIHVSAEAGSTTTLPLPNNAGVHRTLYVFGGSSIDLDGQTIEAGTGAVVDPTHQLEFTAGKQGAEVLVLQGRPIGEPVARYGPFVMNTKAEIQAAFDDYQSTQFGGWPWDTDDPNHGDADRFAQSGERTEKPGSSAVGG